MSMVTWLHSTPRVRKNGDVEHSVNIELWQDGKCVPITEVIRIYPFSVKITSGKAHPPDPELGGE